MDILPSVAVFSGFDAFMQGGGWALYALAAAVFSAMLFVVNQYMRQPGDMLMFLMRVFIILMMLPFARQIDWPADAGFYGVVFLSVLASTSSDIRAFDVSAKYGGGVVSRVMPVTVLAGFVLWFFFDPSLLLSYASRPAQAAAIALAMGLCVFCAVRMNRCDVSRAALRDMAPALAGYTLIILLNKFAIDYGAGAGSFAGVVYGYMFAQSLMAVLVAGPYMAWRRHRRGRAASAPAAASVVPRRLLPAMLLGGGMVAAAWIAHMAFKNYAIAYTANPAYQAAINLTAPVMILLFYRMIGHREGGDVRYGMGIVGAVLLLVLATAA